MPRKKSNGLVIGVIVVIALLFGAFLFVPGLKDSVFGPTDKGAVAEKCAIDTTLSINAYSELSRSTNLSPVYYVRVNGGNAMTFTSGTTKLSPGDSVEVLATLADYLDTTKTITVVCGANRLDMGLYASNDVAGFRVKNTDGDFMTDSLVGGAYNQTAVSAGQAMTWDVEIRGTDKQSTGNLVVVVELGSTANVTSITMSGTTAASIPSFYSMNAAGSKAVAFNVPAIIGSATSNHVLTTQITSAKTISGIAYFQVYSAQAFLDTDGKFVTDGIMDSAGATKYEDESHTHYYINAA